MEITRSQFVGLSTLAVFVFASFGFGEDKGICPNSVHIGTAVYSRPYGTPRPAKVVEPVEKPMPEAKYLGRVTMLAGISDKGYVCGVKMIRGLDSKIDGQVLERFAKRRFSPETTHGKPAAADMIAYLDLWRKPDGEIVEFPDPKLPKL